MSESSSAGPVVSIIIVLLVAILLSVTNPSKEAHREAIGREYGREHPVAGAVGLGAISAEAPTYHSFVLGSYTTVGDSITSIGALGMVQVPEPQSR
jgi:hypothetical protein